MAFSVKSITDVIDTQGNNVVDDMIGCFSCRYNSEIDVYLRTRAIDFSRKSVTVTHLVFDDDSGLFVGYFALTHKPVVFHAAALSGVQRKRVERFARLNAENGAYTVSAFLIAQIGKNYLARNGELITGEELLALARNRLLAAKAQIGGQVVFVEMEHGNAKLAKFYADNGFVPFGTRDDFENGKSVTYDQQFLFLK